NCAYPSSPPPRLHTHRLRYRPAGHAGAPPPALVLTLSSAPNDVRVVVVRVIPVVAFPFGSLVASANWTLASATKPLHTEGVVVASVFVARKSSLSTAIWLLICASEMFSSVFLDTTCTATGTVISCRATRAARPDVMLRAVNDSMRFWLVRN